MSRTCKHFFYSISGCIKKYAMKINKKKSDVCIHGAKIESKWNLGWSEIGEVEKYKYLGVTVRIEKQIIIILKPFVCLTNCIRQKEALSTILFNIYTNEQPIHDGTRSFIYADDLCITVQYSTVLKVEDTIEEAPSELTKYYRTYSLRENPEKNHVTASFHLRNREAKRSLAIAWNGIDLENTTHPKYLGVTLT